MTADNGTNSDHRYNIGVVRCEYIGARPSGRGRPPSISDAASEVSAGQGGLARWRRRK